MNVEPIPLLPSPLQRIAAEGRILAGFLTEETAKTLGHFIQAPIAVQNSIRQRFGAFVALAQEAGNVHPTFRHVDEVDAIEVLAGIARQECGGPVNLSNLVGFEWIGIAGILAGHYVAAPMPMPGRSPVLGASTSEIAQYCIFGSQVAGHDFVLHQNGILASPERLRLHFKSFNFGPNSISAEYMAGMEPSPVTVLLVENRAIAVGHLERLVALLQAGFTEALCLVCYGYGTYVLGMLPTVDAGLLQSPRPPRITDFTRADLMLQIPVRPPMTLIRFSQEIITVA